MARSPSSENIMRGVIQVLGAEQHYAFHRSCDRRRCGNICRETGVLDSGDRLLVSRNGEILRDQGTGDPEAQACDVASQGEKAECDADDGSA